RAHETEPVVLPQSLRVHPAQLRRDRDREHRAVLVHQRRALPSRSARGFSSGIAAANALSAASASGVRWFGTATTTLARRSPVPFAVLTPRPLTRSTRPFGVPGATR